ncbi:MFS transporter [Pseudonocardia spinosispora]|uniref:MFS transporter n=1 Tax=Pseudonocardia spinosispora TaxID=103441 RepID=UPI000418D472|nr:MFS transporter [Pseudonocardia spinosispora]
MPWSAEAEAYTSGQRWIILISAVLGYVTDGYNLLILTFALPSITTGLGISAQQAGTVITLQLVASIVGGALFGRIADSLGRKRALSWSIALFSVGALLSAFSWNYSTLLLTRFLAGIGLGGEWGVGMALFSEAWTRHRGLGAAVIQSSLPIGSLLAGVVTASIISDWGPNGWRVSLATGCLPILLCVVIRLWMPESRAWLASRTRHAANGDSAANLLQVLRDSKATTRWLLAFGLVLGYMISFYSVTSWMPTFIVRSFHEGPAVWQEVNTFAVWVVIPLKIAIGLWGDRVGRKVASLVPAAFTLAGSIGIVLVGLSPDRIFPGSIWTWSLFWMFFLWSMGNAQSSLMGAWLPESFETRIRATATSTAYMFGRGGSALAPSAVAFFAADNLGLGMGVASIVGVILFTMCAVLLPETNSTQDLADDRLVTTPKGNDDDF